MNLVNGKKVKMTLVGVDGNIFAVIGAWKKNARAQGWTWGEMHTVTEAAMQAKSYDHALVVIKDHCTNE